MAGTRVAEKPPPGASPPVEIGGRRLWKRALEEVVSITPAWIFFTLLFSLLWLTQAAILREHRLHPVPPLRVLVGSILVAKGLLLIDMIPLFRELEKKPVLVAAFWKMWYYFVALFLLQYLDGLFDHRHQGWAAGNRAFLAGLSLPQFWVLQLWLVVSLFLFSAIRNLVHKLGRQRSRELLIGR